MQLESKNPVEISRIEKNFYLSILLPCFSSETAWISSSTSNGMMEAGIVVLQVSIIL